MIICIYWYNDVAHVWKEEEIPRNRPWIVLDRIEKTPLNRHFYNHCAQRSLSAGNLTLVWHSYNLYHLVSYRWLYNIEWRCLHIHSLYMHTHTHSYACVCVCILAVQMTNYVNLTTPFCVLCKLEKNVLTSSFEWFDTPSVFYETV